MVRCLNWCSQRVADIAQLITVMPDWYSYSTLEVTSEREENETNERSEQGSNFHYI
jgi:hypothetical protein